MFESVKQMSDAVKPAATLLSDRVSVTHVDGVTGDLVDKLAWTSVFGADAELLALQTQGVTQVVNNIAVTK